MCRTQRDPLTRPKDEPRVKVRRKPGVAERARTLSVLSSDAMCMLSESTSRLCSRRGAARLGDGTLL